MSKISEEYEARARARAERYSPKWKPQQNAQIRKHQEAYYLVCSDGTAYMWVPRKLGKAWQLIRITKRGRQKDA